MRNLGQFQKRSFQRQAPPMEKKTFWREYFIYSIEFLPLTAGTANALPTALAFSNLSPPLKIDSDSDFEFISTMYTATDPRVYIRLRDNTFGRYLHDIPALDMRHFGGQALNSITANGFVAYEWQTPYLIRAASSLGIEAADFSGSSNTVRISFHGCKVRPGTPPYARQYSNKSHHCYIAQPTTISANQTQNFVISMDNDSDFLISSITGSRSGAALVNVKNKDSNWMNIPVHFDNFVGNGNFPNILKYPKFLGKGETLTITVQDLSGSNNTVSLYFYGWKLFG